MEPQIIKGPTVSSPSNGIIYHVTLASGMIATNPSAFPAEETAPHHSGAVVTEDGRVLSVGADYEQRTPSPLSEVEAEYSLALQQTSVL